MGKRSVARRMSHRATPPRARSRPIPGVMNKSEARYAREVLEPQKRVGEILDWRYEAMKLRLGSNCFYTPDFFIVNGKYVTTI